MYSSNELQSLMRKAIIGAGFETGIAEDVSRAGVWLCQNGFQGADQVLEIIKSKVPKTNMILDDDGIYTFKEVYVLACGPSILDVLISQAIADSAESKMYLKNIDNPLLLIALVENAAQENNVEIELYFSGFESRILSPIKAESITELSKVVPKTRTDASIICNKTVVAKKLQNTAKIETSSITVSDKTLQGLNVFAAKTYVPASEASRLAGAGAGLTDND